MTAYARLAPAMHGRARVLELSRVRDGQSVLDLTTGTGMQLFALPVLGELGFTGLHREYLTQMPFPTEIVTAIHPLTS